jgi:hypothetical protein
LADDALEPHHGGQAGLEVQVRPFVLHHHAEELVDFRLAFHFDNALFHIDLFNVGAGHLHS